MTDSGWEQWDAEYVDAARTIGEFRLSASSSGEWRVYLFAVGTQDIARGTVDVGGVFARLDAAKRAAEDALLAFCDEVARAIRGGRRDG
jgi:hypothetical protein